MDPILKDIYSLVMPAAPYVIAAYGILWISLVVYVGLVWRRLAGLEREMRVLEEAVEARNAR